MKILATFVSVWDEDTIETPCVLNAKEKTLTIEPFESEDDIEHLEHLESERVDVELPNGETFSLLVEDGELVEGQYFSLMDAISNSAENPIELFVCTEYNSVGTVSSSVVVGTKGNAEALAERSQMGIQSSHPLAHVSVEGTLVTYEDDGLVSIVP
jgi:3-methyladenine DNA glycosylase AlkC